MSKKLMLPASFLFMGTLLAQKDSLPTNLLDEVVVTANKMEQKQSTTGKVITVITKEQIERNPGKTIAQMLNEQAGITINGALNNAGAVQTVYMRGASAGRTLILMDGIPLNDPSTITTDFDLNLFSINDVERIEVCKGAQSTLYGSDAIAGVINIITVKKNIQRPFNLKATLSQGNLGTTKTNLQFFGKKNKLTYTARFARLYTNGFSSAYDSTGLKNFDKDRYDGVVANAQLVYQFNPKLSVKAFTLYSQYDAGIDAGVFRDDKDYNIHNNSLITGTGLQYRKTGFSLNVNYQYSRLTRNYLNDSLDKTSTLFENNTYRGRSHFAEVYAGIRLSESFTLLTGADYRYNAYNQDYFSISAFGPYSSSFRDTSLHQKALYASLIINSPDKKFNLELGGRFNQHSRYGDNSTYTLNPSYALSDKLRIFGSISSGFKAPSLYQLSINAQLDAEKSVNYEGGISHTTKKFQARMVLFNRKINNGIDYNYITFKYFNYVKQTVTGIEWEMALQPAEYLQINANYSFLASEEITQNRITTKDTVSYNYLLRRPKHSINLSVTAEPMHGLSVSLTGKYVSKRYDIGGYKKADIALDSYFLLGASAGYLFNEHIRFFAEAQNITGKQFFDVRGFNSLPFIFNTGITFNW